MSPQLATQGVYQQMMGGRLAQLLRLRVDEAHDCIPEVSANKYALNIRFIVVHDIEGTQAGAISVFKRSSSQASAHYITRASDGHIVQMVREGNNAWHAGHGWFNRHSIGIEHEGFAHRKNGGGFYTDRQYRASAHRSATS